MPNARILVGDNRQTLKTLPDQSVQCVVTSPPYWGLRDYGTATWIGGDPDCTHRRESKKSDKTITGHKNFTEMLGVGDAIYKDECPRCGAVREDEQIGLEQTPGEFVEQLCKVFDEVWRVLKNDGTLWLNLGDSYVGTGSKGDTKDPKYADGRNGQSVAVNNKVDGLKSKDLVGIPWRVAFALQERGWYLRQDIIWAKPNPMPESVTDRCTKSHEYIFLLTKSPRYYFDHEAIKEPTVTDVGNAQIRFGGNKYGDSDDPKHATKSDNVYEGADTRNKRDVWTVATRSYKEAHFATYPTELITPCILAGTSEKGNCADCGTPWQRAIESERKMRNELDPSDPRFRPNTYSGAYGEINGKGDAGYTFTKTLGWEKACKCETNEVVPALVLDPFSGSGTTGEVALAHGRDYVGTELNPEYALLSEKRIVNAVGMLGEVIIEGADFVTDLLPN